MQVFFTLLPRLTSLLYFSLDVGLLHTGQQRKFEIIYILKCRFQVRDLEGLVFHQLPSLFAFLILRNYRKTWSMWSEEELSPNLLYHNTLQKIVFKLIDLVDCYTADFCKQKCYSQEKSSSIELSSTSECKPFQRVRNKLYL